MEYPSPDPSASLSPYQVYRVAMDSYVADVLHWVGLVVFIGLSLLIVFMVVTAIAVSYRR